MSKWMFYMINVESMTFDAEFFCVRLVFFTYEKKVGSSSWKTPALGMCRLTRDIKRDVNCLRTRNSE